MGEDFWLGQLPDELLEDALAERSWRTCPPVHLAVLPSGLIIAR
jgi:hypothetical protein